MIREVFADYTVIMVSHQLQLVMDYFERVVVLEEGTVVEMGNPRELAKQAGSRFARLWDNSNPRGEESRDVALV